jgi:DNA-directed RNA polymerase subunit RPC12/RpoP
VKCFYCGNEVSSYEALKTIWIGCRISYHDETQIGHTSCLDCQKKVPDLTDFATQCHEMFKVYIKNQGK